jgi:hypothetical protein
LRDAGMHARATRQRFYVVIPGPPAFLAGGTDFAFPEDRELDSGFIAEEAGDAPE